MKLLSFREHQLPDGQEILLVDARVGSETINIGNIGNGQFYLVRLVPVHIFKEVLELTIPDTQFRINDEALLKYRKELEHGS